MSCFNGDRMDARDRRGMIHRQTVSHRQRKDNQGTQVRREIIDGQLFCRGCRGWRPVEAFGDRRRSEVGKRARCLSCEREAARLRKAGWR